MKMRLPALLALPAMVAVAVAIFGACGIASAQVIEADAVQLHYDGRTGAQVSFDGVPLFRSSSLECVAPGWSKVYYSSGGDAPRIAKRGDSIVVTHTAAPAKAKFTATETFDPAGANRIDVTLSAKLDEPAEARVQWALALVSADLLYGGAAVSPADSDALVPIAPQAPAPRDPVAIVGPSSGVRFTTRLGRIIIKIEGGGPAALTVLDGRRAPERMWSKAEPTLWIGLSAVTIKSGQSLDLHASITFEPKQSPAATSQSDRTTTVTVEKIDRAIVPTTRPLEIIPTPKQLKLGDGQLKVGPDTRIFVFKPAADRAAEMLRRSVRERFGWDWELANGIAGNIPANGVNFLPRDLDPQPHADAGAEGYSVRVIDDSATIYAASDAGYAHGAATLAQMIGPPPANAAANEGVIPVAEVDDSPSLEFRGLHYYPARGAEALDFYRKLVERVLAPLKFNHIVLQCENTQWDTDRKIWAGFSVPKDQLAQYVKIARDNGIEPIPLVQSLGHMEWMFRNRANRELAEDPDQPYAYAVTNPKSYDFIHAIDAEAIEIFKPLEYFHIGHDEVDMRGRYPHREDAKKLGKSALIAMDLKRQDEFFRPRGIKMMLWGDMLLSRDESNDNAANAENATEAKRRRDAIPRDAVIADWHYTPAPSAKNYISLKLFHDEGFRTLACTWFRPDNIKGFAAAAKLYGAWGLLQTTWAGNRLDEETLARDPKHFAAYVYAGEYGWTAGASPSADKLAWRAEEVLLDWLNPRRQYLCPAGGTLLSWGGEASSLGKFLGYVDLSALAKVDRIDDIRFRIGTPLTLNGKLLSAPSQEAAPAKLEANVTAGELAFLHATAFRAPAGAEVARYEIRYADDSLEKVPLRYGREIRAWDDVLPAAAAPGGWVGQTPAGIPVAVRVLRWTNPHPDKPIKSIMVAGDHPYASATLFAVTAIDVR